MAEEPRRTCHLERLPVDFVARPLALVAAAADRAYGLGRSPGHDKSRQREQSGHAFFRVAGDQPLSAARRRISRVYAVDLEAAEAAVREQGGEITKDIFEFPGGARGLVGSLRPTEAIGLVWAR